MKQDIVTKQYMRENTVFADVFNYLIYQGKQVIDPKQLKELDVTEFAVIPISKTIITEKKPDTVQKYRDLLKAAVIMHDNTASYILLGIENQTEIHYAMPVRNLIYDALQYGRQVHQKASSHRVKKNGTAVKSAEFLSGFYKEDRILPVVTLVIHFGADEWDGPLSLHDMMPPLDDELSKYVQDYHIHLIDPAKLTEEELLRFQSSFREVMGYIKYSKDKNRLKELLKDNPRMQLEANAARVISTVTNTNIEIANETEVVDMCKAIEDMMNESKNLGITDGEAKGIIETGCEFGISREDILERLQKKLNVSLEKAQEYFAMFGNSSKMSV